jgi:hypothetical protein
VGRDNYGYFFGFVLWGWIATVYAVWLSGQPFLLCGHAESHVAHTCTSAYRTIFAVAAISLVACTLLEGLVLRLAGTGNTVRGFLSGSAPQLAVFPGACFINAEARLGPKERWWRLAVPGLGIDTRDIMHRHKLE